MAGIDNTLLCYVATELLNITENELMDRWMINESRNYFLYGRSQMVYWVSKKWRDSILKYKEDRDFSLKELDAQAAGQAFPGKNAGEYTLESRMYQTMMDGARASGRTEQQNILLILRCCEYFELPEAEMRMLRKMDTLDALVRHLITKAKETCTAKNKTIAQRHLMYYANMPQLPDGYFSQRVTGEDGREVLAVTLGGEVWPEKSGKGEPETERKLQFRCDPPDARLMEKARCMVVQAEGGMGKTTLVNALYAYFNKRAGEKGQFAGVYRLPMHSVQEKALDEFSRCDRSAFDDRLLFYCLFHGDVSEYIKKIRIPSGKKQPLLILLDSWHECEGSYRLQQQIENDLAALAAQSNLCVIVTSRLPVKAKGLENGVLSGTPREKCGTFIKEHGLPDTACLLMVRPLYYNLFFRMFSGKEKKEEQGGITRFSLLENVLREDMARMQQTTMQDEKAQMAAHVLVNVLPRLALYMAERNCHAFTREQLQEALQAIDQAIMREKSKAAVLHGIMMRSVPFVLSCERRAEETVETALASGWLVDRGDGYRFVHQEHRDFLAAWLLMAQMQYLARHCHTDEQPEFLNLNRPRNMVLMLKEELLRFGTDAGLKQYAEDLPEVEYACELTPGIVAYGDAVRQMAEYFSLPMGEFAPVFLRYFKRITDCVEAGDAVQMLPECTTAMVAIVQKAVQCCRQMKDYDEGLRILAPWEDVLPLRHARAKLLLYRATEKTDNADEMRRALALLKTCADEGYYFSCSLQGMFLSATPPAFLRQGLLQPDYVQAAIYYLRGIGSPDHQGYDTVYLVRNLLILLFRGMISVPRQAKMEDVLAMPERFIRPGNGKYLSKTPYIAKELLQRYQHYDAGRCALALGCYHINQMAKNSASAKKAAHFLGQDASLMARLLLQRFLNGPAVTWEAFADVLCNEKNQCRPVDAYSHYWQYLDAKRLALSLEEMEEGWFDEREKTLPPAVAQVLAMCAEAANRAVLQEE